MSEVWSEAGIEAFYMSKLWGGARMADIDTRIISMLARGSKPLAQGSFISYAILSILAFPLVLDGVTWFGELQVSRVALVVLIFKILLDAGVIWTAMARTLRPKVRENICPKCNISMTANGYSCPTCGWTFTGTK